MITKIWEFVNICNRKESFVDNLLTKFFKLSCYFKLLFASSAKKLK